MSGTGIVIYQRARKGKMCIIKTSRNAWQGRDSEKDRGVHGRGLYWKGLVLSAYDVFIYI